MNRVLNGRVWAEVDLSIICENYRKLKIKAKDKDILCVIKADAYGHGSINVAHALKNAGANYFAVATVDEALELRASGLDKNILLLGYFDTAYAEQIVLNNITVAVFDIETAKLLSDISIRLYKVTNIHLKIDTGMNRLGFKCDCNEITDLFSLPNINVEGIFTHFAVSDEKDSKDKTYEQFDKFLYLQKELEKKSIKIPIWHCANSGALLQYDCMQLNMVRAGILLYGYTPDFDLENSVGVLPAMTFKARVAQIKHVKRGECVSYGFEHIFEKDSTIAIITIGYADGLFRSAAFASSFSLHGEHVPIVGRICMDMCIVDITHVKATVLKGDEIVIFGVEDLGADILAKNAKTITYEVLCALSHRVSRIYK